ncbi:hypothetical protein EDC56_1112 [Sinobacterium caligoides]|uniref:Uncharacterized protein n=1 Tax=Sinobacterium caligoides TaxID=933926 RepID=A0A3N2E1X9_9GAMM|nr:hypothetical protein [Sinobacterium caligoides]ROS05575.1 hypothetical protein EDC56_1112 [Sinobacterium caligoides]
MPFQPVLEEVDEFPGNFPVARRVLYNRCGNEEYEGSIRFRDVRGGLRVVPIFNDECFVDNCGETYSLLKTLRKGLRASSSAYLSFYARGNRSIHQNEFGYLPFRDDGGVAISNTASPAIGGVASAFGGLPNKQSNKGVVRNRGQFLEYTCGDGLNIECRLIVDYRFGFIYMTFGHYHKDSFALLVRSTAELRFELMAALPAINASYDA